jgi:hypothetical protein
MRCGKTCSWTTAGFISFKIQLNDEDEEEEERRKKSGMYI